MTRDDDPTTTRDRWIAGDEAAERAGPHPMRTDDLRDAAEAAADVGDIEGARTLSAKATLRADGGEETTGDRLDDVFASTPGDDERPDEVDVGDVTLDTAEFHERLDAIANAADAVATLSDDVRALRETGLRDDDVVDLLYGRNAGLNKSTIETVIETLDDIERRSRDKPITLLHRLVADLGDLTLDETGTVFRELGDLRERYGGDDEADR